MGESEYTKKEGREQSSEDAICLQERERQVNKGDEEWRGSAQWCRGESLCAEQKEARQCKHGGEEAEAFRQLEGCGSGNDHF